MSIHADLRLLAQPGGALVRRADEQAAAARPPQVPQLKAAIRELIAAHHTNPTPFVWTKSADEILASIARFAQRTLDFQAAPLIARTTRSGH